MSGPAMSEPRMAPASPSPSASSGPTRVETWHVSGRLEQMFSPRSDRIRRRSDLLRVVLGVLLLGLLALSAPRPSPFDLAVDRAILALPDVFGGVWRLVHQLAPLWCLAILAVALLRRRFEVARDMVLAVVAAAAGALVLGRLTTGSWPASKALTSGGASDYPAVRLALVAAAIAAATAHLAAPLRRVSRWLVVGAAVASLFLGYAHLSGVVAGYALGAGAAALVLYVLGNPTGQPDLAHVVAAVGHLGVHLREAAIARHRRDGAVIVAGRDDAGPLEIHLFGRDAWDGQILDSVARGLRYRNRATRVALSRLQLAEHEAVACLLAERAGVGPRVVTVAVAPNDDVLLVVRPPGEVDDAEGSVVERLDEWWQALGSLHGAGVGLRELDPRDLRLGVDGTASFGDLSAAELSPSGAVRAADAAQLLAISAARAGVDAAVAAAGRALDPDVLGSTVGFLQPAVFTTETRALIADRELDLEALRQAAAAQAGIEVPELEKIQRVTVGSLVRLAMLAFAGATMIFGLSSVDWSTFADAVSDANWAWFPLAFAMGALARSGGGLTMMGASPADLEPGPTFRLQFAISYISMAVPTAAGRIAASLRFQQRFGVTPAAALSAGIIDNLSGFVVQVTLIATAIFVVRPDLSQIGDGGGTFDIDLIFILAGLVVVALVGLGLWRLPKLQARVREVIGEARSALQVLRSPRRVAMLLGGGLIAEIGYAAALGLCLRAFGVDIPISELILVQVAVGLFAGLMPIPGGVGVAEAAMAGALGLLGVDPAIALAATVTDRLLTFYLPPIQGYVMYRGLRRDGYL